MSLDPAGLPWGAPDVVEIESAGTGDERVEHLLSLGRRSPPAPGP